MKTFGLTILIFIGSIHILAGPPPELVLKAFRQKFPSANSTKWSKEQKNFWKANFKLKDKNASVTFTSDGHWIHYQMEINVEELREEVRSAVKEDYPGCEIISVNFFEFVGSPQLFEVKTRTGSTIDITGYMYNGSHIPRF